MQKMIKEFLLRSGSFIAGVIGNQDKDHILELQIYQIPVCINIFCGTCEIFRTLLWEEHMSILYTCIHRVWQLHSHTGRYLNLRNTLYSLKGLYPLPPMECELCHVLQLGTTKDTQKLFIMSRLSRKCAWWMVQEVKGWQITIYTVNI